MENQTFDSESRMLTRSELLSVIACVTAPWAVAIGVCLMIWG